MQKKTRLLISAGIFLSSLSIHTPPMHSTPMGGIKKLVVAAWVACALSMNGGQAQTLSPTTFMPTEPPSPSPTWMPTELLTTTTKKIPTKLVVVEKEQSQSEKNLELLDRIIGWGLGAIAGTCICWGAFWIVFTVQHREKRRKQREEAEREQRQGAQTSLIEGRMYTKQDTKNPHTLLMDRGKVSSQSGGSNAKQMNEPDMLVIGDEEEEVDMNKR